jgi:predicted ATPase
MWITSYKIEETSEIASWRFEEVHFGRINLIVGLTGSGKSRFINTIYNLAKYVTLDEFKKGYWAIELIIGEVKYRWEVRTVEIDGQQLVVYEKLTSIDKEEAAADLIVREDEKFEYKGTNLPKLSRNSTGVYLLREEDEIQRIYQGFQKILKREFYGDELRQNCNYGSIPDSILKKMEKKRNLDVIFQSKLDLNAKLFLLERHFNDIYLQIVDRFKSVFPSIETCSVSELSSVIKHVSSARSTPVFTIKEKRVDKVLGLQDLSSGMQKVLLLITDIYTVPDGGIYLIDEYENSLGVNAINFFPSFMQETSQANQFIITSHHPYLINNIPVKEWYVFHREGSDVKVKYGAELEERFGKSKQQAFVKLINDSFFLEGKE